MMRAISGETDAAPLSLREASRRIAMLVAMAHGTLDTPSQNAAQLSEEHSNASVDQHLEEVLVEMSRSIAELDELNRRLTVVVSRIY